MTRTEKDVNFEGGKTSLRPGWSYEPMPQYSSYVLVASSQCMLKTQRLSVVRARWESIPEQAAMTCRPMEANVNPIRDAHPTLRRPPSRFPGCLGLRWPFRALKYLEIGQRPRFCLFVADCIA